MSRAPMGCPLPSRSIAGRLGWLLSLAVLLPLGAAAAEYGPEDEPRQELSIGASAGFSHGIWDSARGEMLATSITWRLWGLRRDGLRRHSLGVELAPGFIMFQDGANAYGVGLTLVGRHYLTLPAPTGLFVDWGAGALRFSDDVPPGTLAWSYSLRLGAGLQHNLSSGLILAAGYRFHHISNAGLGPANYGMNHSSFFVDLGQRF